MQKPEARENIACPRDCQKLHMVSTQHVLEMEENEAERAGRAYHRTESMHVSFKETPLPAGEQLPWLIVIKNQVRLLGKVRGEQFPPRKAKHLRKVCKKGK